MNHRHAASRRAWLSGLAGAVILALTGCAFTASSGQPTVSSADTLRGYFEALAASDAAGALKYAATPPSDTTFLTDAVLQASNAISPIGNIEAVANNTGNGYANFTIGTQPATADVNLVQVDGAWALPSVASSVNLSEVYLAGQGMTLDNVALDTLTSPAQVTLFPGTYQLAVGNPLLAVAPDQVVVTTPVEPMRFNGKVVLAADAQPTLAAAAKSKLDACMAEKQLMTSCGFGYSEVFDEDDQSTVVWTVTPGYDDDFTTCQFGLRTGTLKAWCTKKLDLTVTWSTTDGQRWTGGVTMGSVSLDVTDPANIAVTFSAF